MNPRQSSNWTVVVGRVIAILSAVLGSNVIAAGATEQILYSFQGGNDGAAPYASLIADSAGNLYGTTSDGGNSNCEPFQKSCGIVFELSPPAQQGGEWTETVLHMFQGGTDGAVIWEGLIADASGNLYGTTYEGGTGNCNNLGMSGCGTIYELMPPGRRGDGWSYTVLYSFQGVPSGKGEGDAAWPNRLAFGSDGNLYGFAFSGGICKTDETGTYCGGALFELENPAAGGTWTETILFRFRNPINPPASPIFDKKGNLYGTGPGGAYGFGGIFRMKRPREPGGHWAETVLYSFQGIGDGAFANFGLVFDGARNLYGTSIGDYSYPGNLFELSPPTVKPGIWSASVLHNFTGGDRGYNPNGSLILGADGSLYGTAAGQAFELVAPRKPGGVWTYKVLHTFGSKGGNPAAGLIFGKGGVLYGTTANGGSGACPSGCGTVFEIMP